MICIERPNLKMGEVILDISPKDNRNKIRLEGSQVIYCFFKFLSSLPPGPSSLTQDLMVPQGILVKMHSVIQSDVLQ
jgi:hypothetical protein